MPPDRPSRSVGAVRDRIVRAQFTIDTHSYDEAHVTRVGTRLLGACRAASAADPPHQRARRRVQAGPGNGRGRAAASRRRRPRQRCSTPAAAPVRSLSRRRHRRRRFDERRCKLVRDQAGRNHRLPRRLDAVRGSGRVVDVRDRPVGQDRPRRIGPEVAGRGRARLKSLGRARNRRKGPHHLSGWTGPLPDFPDSAALVRVDLATRKLDTAAFFKIPKRKMSVTQTEHGMSITNEINPLPLVDDWAVLADGSIAIVRGQDYHVDFVNPDGSLTVSPKIPFDWQRLSDEDKAAVIDSAKARMEKARTATTPGSGPAGVGDGGRGGVVAMSFGGGDGVRTSGAGGAQANVAPLTFVSINELPDYRPAFSQGGAKG